MVNRALLVYSRGMGISRECDIVEFHRAEDGIGFHGHKRLFWVLPVEHKRESPKESGADILQLVAQAVCLKEMLSVRTEAGALYYGEIHRRNVVGVTDELRERVREISQGMCEFYDKEYTPKVRWSKSCSACSMKDICMPRLGKVSPIRDYIRGKIGEDM